MTSEYMRCETERCGNIFDVEPVSHKQTLVFYCQCCVLDMFAEAMGELREKLQDDLQEVMMYDN